MQYVPLYCRMPGHEVFDELAKEDEQPSQFDIDITCDAATFIPSTYRTKVIRSYLQRHRNEQVAIFRISTAHCRLKYYLSNKLRYDMLMNVIVESLKWQERI